MDIPKFLPQSAATPATPEKKKRGRPRLNLPPGNIKAEALSKEPLTAKGTIRERTYTRSGDKRYSAKDTNVHSKTKPVVLKEETEEGMQATHIIPAATAISQAEFDEQQVARLEALMLKGVKDPKKLMALLSIPDLRVFNVYLRRVHARWEITGSDGAMKRFRGEALHKLDMIESELWVTAGKTNDERTNVVCMQQLMALNKQRQEIVGLSPEVIQKIVCVQDEGNEVLARVNKQAKMVEMLSRFSELLIEGRNNSGQALVEKKYPMEPPKPLPEVDTSSLSSVIDSAKQFVSDANGNTAKVIKQEDLIDVQQLEDGGENEQR